MGLAITYALSVTSLLGGVVQYGTETEKQMVSVERARQYIEQVPAERRHALRMTPPAWPAHGDVVFENVMLQYRPSLPLALNGVTFHVRHILTCCYESLDDLVLLLFSKSQKS